MRNIIKVFGLSILSSVALLGATPIINSGNIEKQIQAPRDIPTLKKDDIKIESYKINTTVGIANGFINAGFGTEKLLNNKKKDKSEETWLNKNKEEGLLCSIAGLGLVNLWDIEGGPNEIEKFMDNNEMNPYKRGGYNIALGLLSSGISDENETALALLSGQLEDKK